MDRMNIDIETYSEKDLQKSGVYAYADDDSFEILLFGVSVDGGKVECYDLANGETLPKEIIEGIKDPSVMKHCFNAQFERVCLGKYLGTRLPPDSWRCTMVEALYLALPGSLAGVGTVLNLDKQKLETGKDLIRFFSVPRKPTKNNPNTRNYPADAPEKWEQYKKYNIRDVETEMEIGEKLSRFPVPDYVWQQYIFDQNCNDCGIEIDKTLAEQAILCDETFRDKYMARAQELTGIGNPNSPAQLKDWFEEQGVDIPSLAKADVAEALTWCKGDAKEVLELRQLLSKSSVKKYTAMLNCICSDGRAHGLLQYYGAARTGRWAGRLVQVQNLPQNHLEDLATARALVRNGEFEAIEMFYDSVPDTLSQLIRTAFVPREGCKYIVIDFSQIEARVLAWIAGEKWRMDMFERGDDLYCTSASQMFGVKVEKHGENSHLRQRGKVAELALGYGGGTGAMKSMGAITMGIPEEDLQGIVDAWRSSNPAIVSFWWDIDKAAISCIKQKKPVKYKCLTFTYESGFMFIRLPSGRRLAYPRPRIYQNEYGRDEISYDGSTTGKKWERISSYGPKFTENIIQAIARDLLAEAMLRLDKAGYTIVMHVHDEAVLEVGMSETVEAAGEIMKQTPEWAEGLILNAAGYECPFYQKD